MSQWMLVGMLLVAVVGVLYRQLVWIPRHSVLESLDELPRLRTAVRELESSAHVNVVEEPWRFVVSVAPLRPPTDLAFRDELPKPGYWFTSGSDDDVARWKVTVNKKAFEWIAEGFDRDDERVVEHRFNPGSYRGNLWRHTMDELDRMAMALSQEMTDWITHLVDPLD